MLEGNIIIGCPSIWLFAAILPLSYLVLILIIRTGGTASRARLVIANILAAAAMLCLGLALSCMTLERSASEFKTVLLLDISDSMDPAGAQSLLDRGIQTLADADTSALIPFAGDSLSYSLPLSDRISFENIRGSFQSLNIGQSNLEQALLSVGPISARLDSRALNAVLLVSDGQENAGALERSIPLLAARGVPVFPIINQSVGGSREELRISHFYAPLVAPAQSSVEVRTSIRNAGNSPQSGLLEVKHDDRVLLSEEVVVPARGEILVTTESDPAKEGIKEIKARFVPRRKEFIESSAVRYLSSEKREKVLLLHGSAEDARLIPDLLRSQAYQTKSVVADNERVSFAGLSDYSAVVVNNLSFKQLPAGAYEALRQFVAGGGGLIFIGGNRSFGLGGYINTPFEEIMPVRMLPPRAEQKRVNIAVELVIDKSQSMAAEQRLDFAKEAAIEVIRNLKDDDFIGVIGFDTNPFEVIRLAQVSTVRDRAMERISRLYAHQATRLFPAMEEARRRLEGVNAGRKHMIIITDGALKDPGPWYIESIKQMRLLGITVSTVLVGSESDFGFLRSMSQAGGGAYYQTSDARSLPRIFLQDVNVRAGERTVREQQEFPVRSGPEFGVSTRISTFPPLLGFVETKARQGSNLELQLISEGDAFPLLASRFAGKGKVLAFTSDANGRWSGPWLRWGKLEQFWSDVVNSARDPSFSKGSNIKFDLRSMVERDTLMLDLSVFDEVGAGTLKAKLILPNGQSREILFEQQARGRYLAEVPSIGAGKFELQINGPADKQFTPVAFALSGDLFGERMGEPPNFELLDRLARATGGKINPVKEDLISLRANAAREIELSPWLLLAASVLLLSAIALREGVRIRLLRGYSPVFKREGAGKSALSRAS